MYNKSLANFIDSANRAGYPYSLEISVYLADRIEYLEYRSFKTMRDAWKYVARAAGEIWKDFPEADTGAVVYGTIWKAGKPYLNTFEHDLICNVGSWDKGSFRSLCYSRLIDGERVYDTVRYR